MAAEKNTPDFFLQTDRQTDTRIKKTLSEIIAIFKKCKEKAWKFRKSQTWTHTNFMLMSREVTGEKPYVWGPEIGTAFEALGKLLLNPQS